MVHRFADDASTADRLGIRVTGLDMILHQDYLQKTVRPFIYQRRMIEPTAAAGVFTPEDILDIYDAENRRHTLVLFDIDGESLQSPLIDIPFLVAANALIFVADPEAMPGLGLAAERRAGVDASFGTVTARILAARDTRADEFTHIPVALVVAKADRLSYLGNSIPNKWMIDEAVPAEEFDTSKTAEENEEVWAYLSVMEATEWLAPVRRFAPASLHFASAAGTSLAPAVEGSDQRYFNEAGFRQVRVLKPLLALLRAHGVAMRAANRAQGGS
jgi:hypothetical protein